MASTENPKRRGFAAMSSERVREFARRGGLAAHRAGTAHEFTSDEAREAGRKGGLALQRMRREAPPPAVSPAPPSPAPPPPEATNGTAPAAP
jgi:uncharacterized protein